MRLLPGPVPGKCLDGPWTGFLTLCFKVSYIEGK